MKHKNFKNNESGVAAIEFALIFPVLLVMFYGTVELGRFIVYNMKINSASYAVAHLITRNATVSQGDINGHVAAVEEIMKPFTFNGTIIVSSVVSISRADAVALAALDAAPNPSSTPVVAVVPDRIRIGRVGGQIVWQYRPVGNHASQIGTVGQLANMPGGYVLEGRQNAIVVEVYGENYSTILSQTQSLLGIPSVTDEIAVVKPRQDSLLVLQP